LPFLTADDLRDLGVTSIGHRRRLREAIAELSKEPRSASPAPASPPPAPAPAQPSERQPVRSQNLERRHLTLMFCDLVGSTDLSARLDPEDLRELLAAYRNCVSAAVKAHRGYLARFVGDGVLVYFGYPHSQERDAERALRCGLEIIRKLARLEPTGGETPAVRLGAATGLVVVGDIVGSPDSKEVDVVGETPNLAARLQTLATSNAMVISDATRALVGDLFECRDLGLVELKGFAAPVRAWQVIGERAVESRFEALKGAAPQAPLIGREGEMARLLERWAEVKSGVGQVVVVTGEAGLGKSRLIQEIHGWLSADARDRLLLQCAPDQQQTPFHPVVQHVEFAAGIRAEDSGPERFEKLERLLRTLSPVGPEQLAVLAEFLRIETSATVLIALRPREARARTVRTVLDLIEAMAARCPVLIVEDVHWADPSTSELLDQLVAEIRKLPILLVATTRPAGAAVWEGLPHVTHLRLDRLQPPELRRIVLSLAGPAGLPDRIVDGIVARSDGVPISAQELTRAVLASGAREEGRAPAVPSTLTESLLARLDSLDLSRETAQLASVIGREFPLELLIAVSPDPPEAVRATVRALIEAGLFVRRHSSFGESVGFYHMLVREAAYQLLLRRDRVALHGRVAEALETRFPEIAAAMPHLVAHHLTEAGEYRKAIVYWQRAGADSAERSASVEALAHL
jgi:class 3 adenylate cyclase